MSKSIAILHKIKDILNQKSLFILSCSLIVPNITSHSRAQYYQPTNALFIKLKTLKFDDLVDLRTALIMHKAHNNLLPYCIQKLFVIRESQYEFRGKLMFRKGITAYSLQQLNL